MADLLSQPSFRPEEGFTTKLPLPTFRSVAIDQIIRLLVAKEELSSLFPQLPPDKTTWETTSIVCDAMYEILNLITSPGDQIKWTHYVELLPKNPKEARKTLPFQFSMGLGDSDSDRDLIRRNIGTLIQFSCYGRSYSPRYQILLSGNEDQINHCQSQLKTTSTSDLFEKWARGVPSLNPNSAGGFIDSFRPMTVLGLRYSSLSMFA